ncbi:tyrosine-protein kinase family protein [Psychromonas ossibalaenae]|uniref:tyrosine-protein kinase family protein n=1 Tax=Psychromonas ossibalaenae TaxID=444922 RepID=UPI00037E2941|nr:tyrosine-protein kinase family protein [Psychromonas ossibalaenae]
MNIPYQNIEIEQIYSQVLGTCRRSIAVCSAESGEGVTSLACALAQRNLLAGHSTLLVDLNLYRPALQSLLGIENSPLNLSDSREISTQPINTTLLTAPQLISTSQSPVVLTGITAPLKRENIIKLRQTGALEQCISAWLEHYDTVILDTSPINRINAQNIPAERAAAACDGAVLIVLAGNTNEAAVSSAVNKLNTAGAQLLGCVLNDRDNPSLKNELLRETQRLPALFRGLRCRLKKFIVNNRLLTLEI